MGSTVVVVGGGIAGLAAAERLMERVGAGRVVLLERDTRLGGKIRTEHVDGTVIEAGPDSFLASKPAGITLAHRLGIAGRLITPRPEHQGSFVRRDGRLHPLPDGISGLVPARMRGLLTTSLLSPRGRMRAAIEPLIPRRRRDGDESIAAFATRRFGREAYDWLIEPLLGGIYAGDGKALSVGATFPNLVETERRTGSLLASLRSRASDDKRRRDGGPRGFVTFPRGMGEFVEGLRAKLDPVRITLGASVTTIERRDGRFRLGLADSGTMEAAAVIIATPADEAARLASTLDMELAAELAAIPFTSTATVSLAFARKDIPDAVRGYGFVSPRAAGGPVVACTCASHKFAGRTAEGTVLFRAFIGRSGDDAIALANDATLVGVARDDLRATYGIGAAPILARVFRWPRALPQYLLGHRDRVQRIAARAAAIPGLAFAGSSYHGVGIPDCIASGWAAADAIADHHAVSP